MGNQRPEVRKVFGFRRPGHTHGVRLGSGATREQIDDLMKTHAQRNTEPFARGVPFGFTDEMVCRPRIGTDAGALANCHDWLRREKIPPRTLGVARLTDAVPIETPEIFRQRCKTNEPAARAIFYTTSRFRQQANAQRVRWHTEAFHKHFGPEAWTSTLVADHIIAPGKTRKTRVALLYSISSDLWQPFGYVHMLDRHEDVIHAVAHGVGCRHVQGRFARRRDRSPLRISARRRALAKLGWGAYIQ